MTADLRIGVDLGGTKIEAIVIEVEIDPSVVCNAHDTTSRRSVSFDRPRELARARVPTERDLGYEHVIEATRALIEEVARRAGVAREVPVGIGMPGATSHRRVDGSTSEVALVKNSNTTCLNGRPFHEDLRRALAGRRAVFANDANCFALAEATWGAARGARVAFGVILGTGVGGGLVLTDAPAPPAGSAATPASSAGSAGSAGSGASGASGASGGHASVGGDRPAPAPPIWEGGQGIAGEWGHMRLEPRTGPPCYCGGRGCVETLLSGPAIEAAYAAALLPTGSGDVVSVAEIGRRAREGEPLARRVIEATLETFGRAIATVLCVVDPDVIVLGGGVSNLDALYDEGRAAVARYVFNDELRTPIVRHALGDSAGVLGAARLP